MIFRTAFESEWTAGRRSLLRKEITLKTVILLQNSNDELSDWLVEPFVKQELKEGGCFEFVTVSNQLSSDHENEQCTAEKSNDEEPEICEVAFHGQLKYLLCDSPILNSVEANVVQKNSKSCQQFRCDGCGRAYTRVDSLKRHQQKCDELLASFQDRQEALERLQQQEYYCNQCGKSYKRLDTLRRHQRNQVCADKDSNNSSKIDKPSL
ncbi:PREDICTED: zinc finger and SCAN domain-containing protein 12-like [Atta colombica]|uniref:zinc finger and SCAN domain-containing protein 12-like n=1 Tax=Atta colombica TaxID=520822 RepID=UPI00084CA5ED|nr:PREDICTED: zinc finger and SCAN domain-containing protein 12-like [Atta colombica]